MSEARWTLWPYALKFTIELSKEDFIKIMDKDAERLLLHTTLGYELEQIEGISEVDYDVHFGPHIYYTVELEHLDGSTKQIDKIIKDYLSEA